MCICKMITVFALFSKLTLEVPKEVLLMKQNLIVSTEQLDSDQPVQLLTVKHLYLAIT